MEQELVQWPLPRRPDQKPEFHLRPYAPFSFFFNAPLCPTITSIHHFYPFQVKSLSSPYTISITSTNYHYQPPYIILIISVFYHPHFHTLLPLYTTTLTCVYLSPLYTITPYTSSLKVSQVCWFSSFFRSLY